MQNSQDRVAQDDEINLVDLAAIFIRRRRIFYASFVLITLLGVVYALVKTDIYEYVTLIESAEKAGTDFIEKPAATVAILQNRWIPEISSSYQAQSDEELPFKIASSNPENTGLIRIASATSVGNAGLVENIHNSLADNIVERQQNLLQIQQKSIKNRIASMDQVIQSLKSSQSSENTGTALASAIQQRAELESELDALQPASLLVVARQSTDRQDTSSFLIVALAVLLGGMLGVLATFLAEFVARVRESLVRSPNT